MRFTSARGDFSRSSGDADIYNYYPQLLSNLGCQYTKYIQNTRTALPPDPLRMYHSLTQHRCETTDHSLQVEECHA